MIRSNSVSLSMIRRSKSALNRSRTVRRMGFKSSRSKAVPLPCSYLSLTLFQARSKKSRSALSSSRLRSSQAVREMMPMPLGRSSRKVFRSRSRSLSESILRETPRVLTVGSNTRYLPGKVMKLVRRGPLEPIRSFTTCTMTYWFFFIMVSMGCWRARPLRDFARGTPFSRTISPVPSAPAISET
ncbi:MAG: hypothetical protein BWX80_03513 [Candidatus Hydrogenedentes bacterium ADurb.Bin101]|nr:MAG: hypothetical protein BWX80_03513 [Candidatus Hydrogenedentes bacterium ADurb.Bin101]